MIAIDLSKQEVLDANPESNRQNNFTGNLNREGNTIIFFIIEETKETILDFSEGTVKVLWLSSYDLATASYTNLFCFNKISL